MHIFKQYSKVTQGESMMKVFYLNVKFWCIYKLHQLLQLLCFWTLSISLFLFKTHKVSEILSPSSGEPTQLGPNDRPNPYLWTPATTQDRI
jgi:hypothetical protein